MKKLNLMMGLFTALFIIAVSCSKDNSNPSKSDVQLIIKSSQASTLKSASSMQASDVVLDTFLVNVSKIEFGINEEKEGISDENEDSIVNANELQGPYLIDLLSQEALSGFSLGSSLLPNATFDEIKLKFEKNTDMSNTIMYNKSLYITGTINNVPFKIESSKDYELGIKFRDSSSFVLNGSSLKLYIDFHIYKILDYIKSIDPTTLKDDDQNGTIEIDPDGGDGNSDIANKVIDFFESESINIDDQNDND